MKHKTVKIIDYRIGDEERIKQILFQSNEPIVLKIEDFTDKFTLDYFSMQDNNIATYCKFENGQYLSSDTAKFPDVIEKIKKNKPYRIFGYLLPSKKSKELESHIPLWRKIPLRLKYAKPHTKFAYFFGGKGSQTHMHFDRENCCLLHLCLCGEKRMILAKHNESENLYRKPFISDSAINFALDTERLEASYPRLKNAKLYEVNLKRGDMLFMPKNCWHYTDYIDASAAVCYAFYPKKIDHIIGLLTGYFYIAYSNPKWGLGRRKIFHRFSLKYIEAEGEAKLTLKCLEKMCLVLLYLPMIVVGWLRVMYVSRSCPK